MQIPTTFQTAGQVRLGGGEIAMLFIVVGAVWLASRIVKAAKAFGEGIGWGIAKGHQQDAARREGPPRRTNKRQPAAYRVGYNDY